MQKYLLKNIQIVNEGQISAGDVLISGGRIEKIAPQLGNIAGVREINGENKYLLPGAIDDQVHFREPGLTHKAIYLYGGPCRRSRWCYQLHGNAQYQSSCTYTGFTGRKICHCVPIPPWPIIPFLWALPTTIWMKPSKQMIRKTISAASRYLWAHQPEICWWIIHLSLDRFFGKVKY